jgi:hypothetical protein
VLFLAAGLLLSAPQMARAEDSSYTFMEGSYRANWGKESWQLVRTENGWKIASVIWSQELNPTPPPKR